MRAYFFVSCLVIAIAASNRRETAELISGMEDVVSDHEVQDKRADDADPDEHVVRVDSDVVPFSVDPAPNLSSSVLLL